jgi:hypothetical protein
MALFKSGDEVGIVNAYDEVVVTGKIVSLRADKWERANSWPQGNYFYHVEYDNERNGRTFDTYVDEKSLRRA